MSNKKIYASIAMPEELVARIDEEAKRERRSRSNLVVTRLLVMFKMDERLAEGLTNGDKT